MHPHTKFGIPTSKNIGDMHWTGSGTDERSDGRRNGQSNHYLSPTVPLGGGGIKTVLLKKLSS